MRALLAISLFLVCFMDQNYATFADFMNNLPSEVATAFSSAWDSISDVIKKPVRIKRLGSGGKLKTFTTSPDDPINPHRRLMMRRPTPTTEFGHFEYSEGTTLGLKVTLPLLLAPSFKSYNEWSDMQKAYYTRHNQIRRLRVQNKNLIEENVLNWTPDDMTGTPDDTTRAPHIPTREPDVPTRAPDIPIWEPDDTTWAPDDDDDKTTTYDYTREEKSKIRHVLYSIAKKKFSNLQMSHASKNDPTLGMCKFLSRLYTLNYDNYTKSSRGNTAVTSGYTAVFRSE